MNSLFLSNCQYSILITTSGFGIGKNTLLLAEANVVLLTLNILAVTEGVFLRFSESYILASVRRSLSKADMVAVIGYVKILEVVKVRYKIVCESYTKN